MRQRFLSALLVSTTCVLLLVSHPLAAAPVIGATDPRVTQATIHQTICVPGYSQHVRPSTRYTQRIKRELMVAAGLPLRARQHYVLDHRISLGLGGAPRAMDNLQLQPVVGVDNARAKDRLETRLDRAVCADRLPLADAQRCFLEDWHPCAALVP